MESIHCPVQNVCLCGGFVTEEECTSPLILYKRTRTRSRARIA
ncbi:hypothetical protein M7I_6445 [Glarea lozoyensis 74030]|uniref:Uncharacterized protein n=1 Tax=Glarea lozoyensis (strain ATCC 74030 / MF5533) TaxID=1104152 RepID=H0EUK8_GLAL7|nr:hypothetical protein M7I_6445 [Glarea lozoyensis 74030]